MKKKTDYKKQGKKNRASGQRFELKVRKDMESKGWIVSKWMNNVELKIYTKQPDVEVVEKNKIGTKLKVTTYDTLKGKLIPSKRKYNPFKKVMMMSGGFPDFITFKKPWINEKGYLQTMWDNSQVIGGHQNHRVYSIFGIEVKSKGYLTPEERAKCKWYLENNIFSKILVASRGDKRGAISYKEVKK